MLLYAFLIKFYFAILYFLWNKLEQLYEFWGLCSREISRMPDNLSQYNRWMEMPQISSRASQSPHRPTHPHRAPKLCLLPYVYLTKYILPYCILHEKGSCRCMTRDTYTYRFFEHFFSGSTDLQRCVIDKFYIYAYIHKGIPYWITLTD